MGKYGKLTAGYGTPEQKEINIIDGIQVEYKEGRTTNTVTLEDGSTFIELINSPESGRPKVPQLWLSTDSLLALTHSLLLYCYEKKLDVKAYGDQNFITANFTDNLKK